VPKLRCLDSLGDWISPDMVSRGPCEFSAGALNQMRTEYRAVALVVDASLAFVEAERSIQSLKRAVRGKHCLEFSRGTFEAGYSDGSEPCHLEADDDLCPNCKLRFEQRATYKAALKERLRAKRRLMRLVAASSQDSPAGETPQAKP
jgi:hypothetical protein